MTEQQAEQISTSITPEEAKELVDNGAVLIDVRMDYEWDAGHIEGARHVEMNDIVTIADSLPRDRPIVFYCRSGQRSSMPTAAFREAGFDAFNVDGGLLAWVEAGLPVEPEDGKVETVKPK